MPVLVVLDTSITMFKSVQSENTKLIDVCVTALGSFFEYTSEPDRHQTQLALATVARDYSIIAPYCIEEEDQLKIYSDLQKRIKEKGPEGRCIIPENLSALEELTKQGFGSDCFLDIFLVTDKKLSTQNWNKSLEDQTRLFIFSFDQTFNEQTVHKHQFIDFVYKNFDTKLSAADNLSELMINRFSSCVSELTVDLICGTLLDTFSLFPQPRIAEIKQHSKFEIKGFIQTHQIIGLPVLSRHFILPNGREKHEPHLLQIMAQADRTRFALVKFEGHYGFIGVMNYHTTSTAASIENSHFVLLITEKIPWIGDFQNLVPFSKWMMKNFKHHINADEGQKSSEKFFPVKSGEGAYLDNKKSYAVNNYAQCWKNPNQISNDLLKLLKLSRRIPDENKNKQFKNDFEKFQKQVRLYKLEALIYPKFIDGLNQIKNERTEELTRTLETNGIMIAEVQHDPVKLQDVLNKFPIVQKETQWLQAADKIIKELGNHSNKNSQICDIGNILSA